MGTGVYNTFLPLHIMFGYIWKTSHKLWKQIYDNGMSIFRSVDVLVCRRFGLSTFWFVDVLVCRRFGLSTFRFVDVSVCRRFGCRRFGLSTFWPVTVQVTIIDIVIRPQCTNRPFFLASISVIWAEFTFMSQSMSRIYFYVPIDDIHCIQYAFHAGNCSCGDSIRHSNHSNQCIFVVGLRHQSDSVVLA